VTLSETSWLDPSYVLTALRRLVFCPSSTLSWPVGIRILISCRQVMLHHPQAVIYQPMLRLLHHMATYQGCVDLRDRALLYVRLLTHTGSASLGSVFHGSPGNVAQMTQMLTPVLPKTIRLVNGPVPFLSFFKSLDERRKLGILDRQCAVFVLPTGRAPSDLSSVDLPAFAGCGQATAAVKRLCPRTEAQLQVFVGAGGGDWERRWGDSGDDHQFPQAWLQLSGLIAGIDPEHHEKFTSVFPEYMAHVQASPASIRLPFVLKYQEVKSKGSEALDWLDFPRQLFALELTFSSSEHFVPIGSIRIPFIAEEGRITEGQEAKGFPRINRLLLKLQPLSPVPTSFGVNIAFNDCLGHMYFGQLETFDVAFQDLFLPVRLPLVFWSDLFEVLWKGGMTEACWSIKVLDLDRATVQELIRSQLGPFLVPSEVNLDEEDFDFEQEEYFECWNDSFEDNGGEFQREVVVHMETICSIVFIPPCYHLLMRFAISSQSTVVRILTDRFQLLSYLDAFFLPWSRGATSERQLSDGCDAGKQGGGE